MAVSGESGNRSDRPERPRLTNGLDLPTGRGSSSRLSAFQTVQVAIRQNVKSANQA
jgi:hypothetical protein